jgi:lysophospholipase L1-like esterase
MEHNRTSNRNPSVKKCLPMNTRKIRDVIVISIIIFIIFFMIGEFFARILKEPTSIFIKSENEKLVYELNEYYEDINSFSMRDKEFDKNTIKYLYKIAVIGDSHSYSTKVKKVEETFPYQIEEYINSSVEKKIVKVINFGVPGYNTAQELEVLKSKALMFNPNLIILQYSINDTHVCNYIQPEYKSLNTLIHKSRFLVRLWKNILYSPFGRKFLFEWIGSNFPDALLFQEGLVGTRKAAVDEIPSHKPHPPRTKDRVPRRYHYMLGNENWQMHIQAFAHLSQQKGIPLIATGFIDEEEKAVFLKEGFAVYSFFEIFQDKDMRVYGYNPDNTASHFDANGCSVIARALAEYIQKHYAISKDK